MDARTYLVGKGLAKPGRGRFSTAAKAELERAMREDGLKFGNATTTGESGIVVSKARANVEPEDLEPAEPLWHHHKAVDADGNAVSMNNVCMHCSYSLPWCGCAQPMAIGKSGHYVEVNIVPA